METCSYRVDRRESRITNTPGSLPLQLLCRLGSLVDDLLVVGVFVPAFI